MIILADVTDFVEPWNFARRTPQDGEMDERASHHVTVPLTSNYDLFLFVSVATSEFDTTDVKH